MANTPAPFEPVSHLAWMVFFHFNTVTTTLDYFDTTKPAIPPFAKFDPFVDLSGWTEICSKIASFKTVTLPWYPGIDRVQQHANFLRYEAPALRTANLSDLRKHPRPSPVSTTVHDQLRLSDRPHTRQARHRFQISRIPGCQLLASQEEQHPESGAYLEGFLPTTHLIGILKPSAVYLKPHQFEVKKDDLGITNAEDHADEKTPNVVCQCCGVICFPAEDVEELDHFRRVGELCGRKNCGKWRCRFCCLACSRVLCGAEVTKSGSKKCNYLHYFRYQSTDWINDPLKLQNPKNLTNAAKEMDKEDLAIAWKGRAPGIQKWRKSNAQNLSQACCCCDVEFLSTASDSEEDYFRTIEIPCSYNGSYPSDTTADLESDKIGSRCGNSRCGHCFFRCQTTRCFSLRERQHLEFLNTKVDVAAYEGFNYKCQDPHAATRRKKFADQTGLKDIRYRPGSPV
ncbi:hypothetical protein BJ508DRAFT_378275 [Ascobolus immersus RN42]|uniref:Uncharacterized protein n=1 Tax=Ascobolus immersus RN42 TaxID=1160509 RepID=A0A3N4HXH6_ASCIM|nr:hypothetical protein BJ508DRAFT_378275 [Ascobolus immersus RN42]